MTDKAVFTVAGDKHYAQLKKIYEDHVTITVRSPDKQDIDLYINETEKVDVNNDDVYDLEMTILEIGKNTAKIRFKTLYTNRRKNRGISAVNILWAVTLDF